MFPLLRPIDHVHLTQGKCHISFVDVAAVLAFENRVKSIVTGDIAKESGIKQYYHESSRSELTHLPPICIEKPVRFT